MPHTFRPLIALLLLGVLVSPSAHAGGGPASGIHLFSSPNCFAVGQKIALAVSLTGVRPGEQVGFSAHPAKAGFGGGDPGLHAADATGRISFTHPGPTMFDWEAGTWIVSAYRHSGPPPYTRPGSVWQAARATFTVAPRGRLRPTCLPTAGASAANLTPAQLVAQYFADLNAHQYHAAWMLEAPCGKSFTFSNGPGAPRGSEGWPSRGKDPGMNVSYWPLTSVRVTRVARLHIPILERHGILAFGVSGWYTFDYSRVPWANMKHRNGFHVVKIARWKCNGRWGVEGSVWLIGSGGELNWT